MAIDTVVEEVAENLEEMAEATRRINTNSVSFFIGGAVFGFAVGFYFGYKWNKEKIKAEAFQQSEEEISKIREDYQKKVIAATPKPSVEEVIEEKGYTRPLRPPVPGLVDPTPVSAPPVVTYDGGKDKNRDWDFAAELASRVPGEPYVIHQDEFNNDENGYEKVVYTYYAEDDVMTDETERPLPHGDLIVGQNNLRWGHGSDDIDVVFVRNDEYKRDMEICRVSESYEQKYLSTMEDYTDDDETS
jgi:hypothetical protein